MAARTSSGTGIVVSLAVFVICTVSLLVLSIVFYAGKREAEQANDTAQRVLAKYVTPAQRNNDAIKTLEGQVTRANDSVLKRVMDERDQLVRFTTGEPSGGLDSVQSVMQGYGVDPEDGAIRRRLEDDGRSLRSLQTEIDGLQATVSARDTEIDQLEDRIGELEAAQQRERDTLNAEIQQLRDATEEYRRKTQEVQGNYYEAIDRYRDDLQDKIETLENEKDQLSQDAASLRGRVAQLQERLARTRVRPDKPELLVDARVIETVGAAGQVFIDRGRKDRIVRGMTFEVYDDASALLQTDPLTGEVPRGKASLQVIKVADTTSTCKITRFVPGRPVVRNDVVANAVYDPLYVFKFLVHGKFDLNNDGRPSEAEANHLRDMIVDWGGEVVRGDELQGDLDFLVLGIQPPMPPRLRENPTATEMEIYVGKRLAHERYQELFRQAREAQIPVLNANRFFVLIGDTGR